jgi:DNA-directed RNA polymerase subunit RPC12/RpoP
VGIRFRCHHCEHELNLKNFQAGRRARCPSCSGRFRVPTSSQDFSMPLEESEQELASTSLGTGQTSAGQAAANRGAADFELRQPSGQLGSLAGAAPETGEAAGSSAAGEALRAIAEARTPNSEQGARQAAPGGLEQLPRAIAEAPQAVWYVRPPSGGQYGPADGQVFFQWMKENRVARDALVWRDGWPQWQVAAEAFEETYGWLPADDAGGTAAAAESALPADTGQVPLAGAAAPTETALGPASAVAAGEVERPLGSEPVAAAAIEQPLGSSLTDASAVPGLPIRREPLSAARRKRTRTNYAIGITLLAVLAIALVAVLIVVLKQK